MNTPININIKSIEAFKKLSDESIKKIQDSAEYFRFSMGRPILRETTIPNSILIIISGRARLTQGNPLNPLSAAVLKSDAIIGLGSLLGASGCEDISASTDLMVMAISDSLILEIYEKELAFKEWCNSTIFPAEAYELARVLKSKSIRNDIQITPASQAILKYGKLKSYKYEDVIETSGNPIFFASKNINEEEMLTKVERNTTIKYESIFYSRFIEIPQSLDKEFTQNTVNSKIIHVEDQQNEKPLLEANESFTFEQINKSNLHIDNYIANKNIELIKGEGLLKETSACIQMICKLLDLPFRRDTVENIINNEMASGRDLTVDSCGGILNNFGLHVSKASIPFNFIDRVLTPCLISWDQSFAIIEQSASGSISILSPKDGKITVKENEFKNIFEEKLDVIYFEKSNLAQAKRFSLSWFLPQIKKYKASLIQVLIASFYN